VRRSDGYYVQFALNVERTEEREPTKRTIGLDVGLNHFYTDSDGNTVENPRNLRKAEKRLKRLQRQVSKKPKGSKNRRKAVKRLGQVHLKVQRQRKDFAVKTARCVVKSNDFVVLEDLQIRNMVKNHHLAKSISDAAWGDFRRWVEYFGKVFGVATVAVSPQYTSQDCSSCGEVVKKSLSTRTHICPHCGHVQDRDHNAAINILKKGLNTVGHTGIKAWGENDRYLNQATGADKLTR
jgi:putative transposase